MAVSFPMREPEFEEYDESYPFSELASFDEMLGKIYNGILENPPWNDALEYIRILMGASHMTLMLRPPTPESTGVMINAGDIDESATESYETHFFALDPVTGLPEGEVISPEEWFGTEQWLQSPMYQDYLRPIGIRHLLTTDIYTESGIECRIRITRGPDQDRFSERDKALLTAALPHFRRAIQLHSRFDYLECERQIFVGAMNRMLLGLVNISADGEILEVNEEAERILSEKDGIRMNGKSLKATSREENKELQRLIGEARLGGITDGPSIVEAMSITREFDRGRLGVVVRSIPFGLWSEASERPAVAVFLRDPDYVDRKPSRDVIRRVFGLTRMEASLALLLARGYSLDDAAAELDVRRNTARTHLRSIFGKTGVSRQTMLVRMILKSVVSLG